jgi:hypothetical protein
VPGRGGRGYERTGSHGREARAGYGGRGADRASGNAGRDLRDEGERPQQHAGGACHDRRGGVDRRGDEGEEERRLQHGEQRPGREVGHDSDHAHPAEVPGHQRRRRRRGERSDDELPHDGRAPAATRLLGDLAAPPPEPRLAARRARRPREGPELPHHRAARDQRAHAGDAQLVSEVGHRARVDERRGRAEREHRPRRRRALEPPRDRGRGEHGSGAHRRRGRSDQRDVAGDGERGERSRRARRDACGPQQQLESARDDRHVQPRDREGVDQPRVGVPVADGRVDRPRVGHHERAGERRVGAEEPVERPAGARAEAGEQRDPAGGDDGGVGNP